MRKLLLICFALLCMAALFSCTRNQDTGFVSGPTSSPPLNPVQLTTHSIDIQFDSSMSCGIWTETGNGPASHFLSYFTLSGKSVVIIGDTIMTLRILVQQLFHRPSHTYFNPEFYLYEEQGMANSIKLETIPANYNFVTLPYNNSPANFTGQCKIILGKGRYSNVVPGILNFSGLADTLNHTGNIRIQGNIAF